MTADYVVKVTVIKRCLNACHPSFQRSWIFTLSTGDVTAAAREEKGEFCVAVAPVTRTADILTQLAKGVGC